MLGNLIGGIVVILVGITLVPMIRDEMFNSTGNITSGAAVIWDMTSLFFILGIAGAGIAVAAQAFRSIGNFEEEEEDEGKEMYEKTKRELDEELYNKELEKDSQMFCEDAEAEEAALEKETKVKEKYPFHKDGICQLTGEEIDSDEECKTCK